MISIQGEGKWPANAISLDKIHDKSKKELVFFITDMHEYDAELTSLIKSLKTKRNEVVVLQVMGERELEFGYKGFVIFEDLETGAKVKVNSKTAKKRYLNLLSENLKEAKKLLSCPRNWISFVPVERAYCRSPSTIFKTAKHFTLNDIFEPYIFMGFAGDFNSHCYSPVE